MNCTVAELKAKLDAGEAFTLLDVRTQAELDIVNLPNALHIPLHEVEERVGELHHVKDTKVVCMCHHGMRSAAAQDILLQHGFTNVLNLTGGIHAYAIEVDDTLAVYQ